MTAAFKQRLKQQQIEALKALPVVLDSSPLFVMLSAIARRVVPQLPTLVDIVGAQPMVNTGPQPIFMGVDMAEGPDRTAVAVRVVYGAPPIITYKLPPRLHTA